MTTLWRVASRTGRIQILHVVELSGCKLVNGWTESGLRIGQSMRRLLLGFKCGEGDCAKTMALEMQRSRWVHRYLREQIHKAGLEEKGYRWGGGEIVVLFCALFMLHRDSHLQCHCTQSRSHCQKIESATTWLDVIMWLEHIFLEWVYT